MPQIEMAVREQLEQRALAAFREYEGRLVEVGYLCGYNQHDDSEDVACDPPIIVRIDRTNEQSVLHWNDEWLDPYWDVTVVRGDARGLRSCWIDGPSVNAITGETEWKHIRVLGGLESMLESMTARLKDWGKL